MRRPHVEILYFDGCPNHERARALVERVAHELNLEPTIELIEVPDPEAATRFRFLGSPTIRVDGLDVEPGVSGRSSFVLSCRLYKTTNGFAGQPDALWVRAALRDAAA